MDEIKVDVNVLSNRCMCCLEEGDLRDMWAEYIGEGEIEIYGAMLKECFEFPWVEQTDNMELICEKCTTRLRSALSFRRDVAAAREVFERLTQTNSNASCKGNLDNIKIEVQVVDTAEEVEEEADTRAEGNPEEDQSGDQQEGDGNEIHDGCDGDSSQGRVVEGLLCERQTDDHDETASLEQDDVEYLSCDLDDEDLMEVEYLEDEDDDDDDDAESSASIKPGSKRKRNRSKLYKQYTQDDLKMALRMVRSQKMTRMEAAEKFSVPVKTLGFKLRAKEKGEDDEDEDTKQKFKLFDEIKTILRYTNATPFKSKIGKLYCAYCSTDGPIFEPNTIRTHTRKQHSKERLKHVEVFMRPYYLNYILKLDIEDLQCTVCDTKIDDWNSMFEHLKDIHSIDLDLAYTRVIPYILNDDIACCLCGKKHPHFHILDSHMNKHYNNYICRECGDTFLTQSRLKKHEETHSVKQFPCTECGKIFALEKYRKKHHDNVHLREVKFKCNYCPEVFGQDYSRHLHVLKHHEGKIKITECEYCGMKFSWRPYYLKHVKQNHTDKEKKYQCKQCEKTFLRKYELKNHEDWHTGRGVTCLVCFKKFSSKPYLQKHMASHSGDSDIIYVVANDDEQNVEEVTVVELAE